MFLHLPLGPGEERWEVCRDELGSLPLYLAPSPRNQLHTGDSDTHPWTHVLLLLGRRQETWAHSWLC